MLGLRRVSDCGGAVYATLFIFLREERSTSGFVLPFTECVYRYQKKSYSTSATVKQKWVTL
jgi:hypothetical protein